MNFISLVSELSFSTCYDTHTHVCTHTKHHAGTHTCIHPRPTVLPAYLRAMVTTAILQSGTVTTTPCQPGPTPSSQPLRVSPQLPMPPLLSQRPAFHFCLFCFFSVLPLHSVPWETLKGRSQPPTDSRDRAQWTVGVFSHLSLDWYVGKEEVALFIYLLGPALLHTPQAVVPHWER